MLNFNYKKGFFNIRESVGDGESSVLADGNADVLMNMELLLSPEEIDKYIQPKRSVYLLLPNFTIDLREPEEKIFKKIHKSTRRNINKAIKREDLKYVELTSPNDKQIRAFGKFYNEFANEVNIKKCDVKKLMAIRDQGALVISYVTNSDNKILCSHTHMRNSCQSFGVYSAIRRKNNDEDFNGQLIGMANKYLDWRNIQSAKKEGCKWYNFGAEISHEDKNGQNVNQYKRSFGTITGYDLRIYSSNNIKGEAFLLLLHFYYKIRRKDAYANTRKILYQNPQLLKG